MQDKDECFSGSAIQDLASHSKEENLGSMTSIEAHQALPRLYAKESCRSLHRRVIFIEGLEPREHYADVSQEQSHVRKLQRGFLIDECTARQRVLW